MKLPTRFPSEAEQLRQQSKLLAGTTAEQRVLAAADLQFAVESLSKAGGRWEQQLKYQESRRLEWRKCMAEFIAQHVPANPQPDE